MKNLKVSKQIYLSQGLVLVLVAILCVTSLIAANKLWQSSKDIYEHPFAVRGAISELQADVLKIRLIMKDVVLETNDQKIADSIQLMDAYEADAFKQFDILYDKYLGPKTDIDATYKAFIKWKPERDESLRLLRAGNSIEAINRTKETGIGGKNAKDVIDNVLIISNFAKNKSEIIYADANKHRITIETVIIIVSVIIIIICLLISILLIRTILTPIKELLKAIAGFQSGKLDARSDYSSDNEFGDVSESFNHMAEIIQIEMQNKENAANISSEMLQEDLLQPFCTNLVKALIRHTNSQMGTIYVLNEQKKDYIKIVSIGLKEGARESYKASIDEGEIGLVIATRKMQHTKEIPTDTQLIFSTVHGDYIPNESLAIPVFDGKEITAIICLATIYTYKTPTIRLLNDIIKEIAARLNNVLAAQKIVDYSQKLNASNVELEYQSKELAVQKDELIEQNIELEMQKKQLDEASQLKSSFLSNMSHELRTPLNSVIALASVLNRRLAGMIPEEEYSYIDVIERNGKNLLALVNDILDLSRIESGKEEINISSFNIYELVAEVLEMIEPQANQKDIVLLNEVSYDLPAVMNDRAKCRHIIQNLIGNAVKFTNEGKIVIGAEIINEKISISVADTGIGISNDQLSYIFDEFRQGDESASKQNGGTGLGLAISKKYANLLQGNVEVTSELGKGSIFTLKIPMTLAKFEDKNNEIVKTEEKHIISTSETSGKHILLVEDSEPIIIQMNDILTEQGYIVKVVRNGKEALEQIQIELPDAMVLDLMMPEIDGFQVLKTIRNVEKSAHIPVLVLTAKHITREELKVLKSNHIYQLIQKGLVGKNELLTAVKNMILEQKQETITRLEKKKNNIIDEKPTILVVEDNPDNMMTVKALLKEEYDVLEAIDGISGIELAKKNIPSLILLDISLPIIDGFQVLKELKKDERLINVPIIALTARAMVGEKEKILSYGFDGYVSKPIDEELLKNSIRGVLNDR